MILPSMELNSCFIIEFTILILIIELTFSLYNVFSKSTLAIFFETRMNY